MAKTLFDNPRLDGTGFPEFSIAQIMFPQNLQAIFLRHESFVGRAIN
jgi:hypothetical protein